MIYKILSKRRRLVLGVAAVLALTGAAFSAGLNVTTYSGNADGTGNAYKAFDLNGAALKSGRLIQIIKGSSAPPDPSKDGFVSSGDRYSTGSVGGENTGVLAVGNVDGEFDYSYNAAIDPVAGPVYVRVWDATTPEKGAYYNQQGGSLKGPGQSPAEIDVNLKTVYKADKPILPKSTAGGFSLAYVPGPNPPTTGVYLPSFTISAVDQSDPDGKTQYEIVGHNIAITKMGDSWDVSRVFAAGSKPIQETDPTDPYYKADGVTEYELRSQAWNYFGGNADGDWGPSYIFKIPASGGAVAGPFEVSYDLKKIKDGMGVNSVGIPFDAPMTFVAIDNTETQINTLQELVNSIGKTKVTAVSYWDEAAQNLKGVTFDADGKVTYNTPDFDPATWNIKAGKGYYISVTGSVSFKLKK